MKAFVARNMAIAAGSLMGLMLVGCQQAPSPPVVVNTPSTERTTTTETKQVETPAPTPAPDSVETKTTEKTTTVEKK